MPTLTDAKEQVRDLSVKALAVVEDATLTSAEKKTKLATLEPDIKKWEDEVQDLEGLEKSRTRFKGHIDGRDNATNIEEAGRDEKAWDFIGKSLGRQFIESSTYKGFLDEGKPTGRANKWTTGDIELKGWSDTAAIKTTLTEGTTASPGPGNAFVATPQVLPGIVETQFQQLLVADLFSQGTTDSPLLRYLIESAVTNAAAPTAEGGAKPESALTFSKADEVLHKIATFLPVSDEMLEDYAQIMSYLDSRLTLFVKLNEEAQLLTGDGTGSNLIGILNRTGLAPKVYTRNAAPGGGYSTGDFLSPTTDTDMDAIYRQITQVRVTSFLEPDAILIDPIGWQNIQLAKDAQGRYYAAGPFLQTDTPTLWGKRVVATTSMPSKTALVGAFKAAAQIFRKGGITVEASNSHNDFFQKDLTAIRAVERLLLAVYRPGAFGIVDHL